MDLSTAFNSAMLGESNPFRESITYTATGQSAKTIWAIPKRGGITSNKNTADKTASIYDYEILIASDATNGIVNPTMGKDTVTMSMPEMGTGNNVFIVAGIVSKTPMCWRLGLRA